MNIFKLVSVLLTQRLFLVFQSNICDFKYSSPRKTFFKAFASTEGQRSKRRDKAIHHSQLKIGHAHARHGSVEGFTVN